MDELLAMIPPQYAGPALIGGFGILVAAALLPVPPPNSPWAPARKLLDLAAFNIGNAKNAAAVQAIVAEAPAVVAPFVTGLDKLEPLFVTFHALGAKAAEDKAAAVAAALAAATPQIAAISPPAASIAVPATAPIPVSTVGEQINA